MESIWTQSASLPPRPALDHNLETDVVVIGAGMAGVLTAWFLQQRGLDVVVLEANRVGSGQTQNTTAKITAQHGLTYRKLIETFGLQKAAQYAKASWKAIADYRSIVKELHISCQLEEVPAYLYTRFNPKALADEAHAAAQLGIEATLLRESALPFPVEAALCFPRQAQFHPLQFLKAVAEPLTIYERSLVNTVEEHSVSTDQATVTAQHIVFASHVPFVNFPGFYFARMHQERSYVLALSQAQKLDGIYYGIDSDGLSFRNVGDLLLLGGGGHRTGENSKGGKYDHLRSAAGKFWPNCFEVARWSAQDGVTLDGVPYIGTYARSRPSWYVATGFRKWGMTGSMVAARLLADQITGRHNAYADVFSPQRFSSAAVPSLLRDSGQACKGISRQLFQVPQETAEALPRGRGGIVTVNGEKAGVYKDDIGRIYVVSPRCPHMGCQLEWNPDEKSWDCPCHGSRFDYKGTLINNPALSNLPSWTL